MKSALQKMVRLFSRTPLLLVVLLAFALGYLFGGSVMDTQRPAGPSASDALQAANDVWTCSMHPQIRQPHEGKCPICGMDLIRVDGVTEAYASGKSGGGPKYACSMFCVPPMSKPGKCPVCGMEMVEVSAEDVGGRVARGTLTLSPTARKIAAIQVAPVERRFVSAEIRMVGKIEYDETRLRYITAWVPGRLDRLYVDYTGIPVNKGEHLVDLYSPELLSAQEELLQALRAVNDLEQSEVTAIRETALQTVDAVREKLRLWGLTSEQIAEIERRGTASDHITIHAPIGGVVIDKNAVEGMYVQTGTRIYTIADLSRVWAKLDAYESDLAWLRYGQEVEFQTEAYPGEIFTGKIAFIDPVLDGRTRTVKVRVNVENADGRLKPQMFIRAQVRAKVAAGGRVVDAELAGKWISPMHPEVVKDGPGLCDVCGMPLVRAETLGYVAVETGDAEPPLVIPASAPLLTGKRAIVYVELPGREGVFQGREVRLGPRAGDHYIVRDGLAGGELVVVNGNFKIDSAMQIRAEPSMMSPESAPDD
jgi:Cu(I)/Ag(I) efflux system membrane fusion protein